MKYYLDSDIDEISDRLGGELEVLSGKTVLITGAAGFLGRYFVSVLQKFNSSNSNPVSIIALDNHVTSAHVLKNSSPRLDPNIEWIYGDASIGTLLPNKFDYVLHAAGIASPEHYRAKPLETIDVAVTVTKSLLEISRKCEARMLFFSSSEIYGDPIAGEVPTNEDYRGNVSSRGPRACYDESKRLGETLCWIYENYFGTHVSVVRPFNVYGPGMMPGDFRVMPNFATSIFRGQSLKVYGHGKQTRTFCYITDAIVGFLKVLLTAERPNVYNVGNPNPEISILDLANNIKKVLNQDFEVDIIPYPKTYPEDEPNRRCPDITRISEQLDYVPLVSLEEGIRRFFGWSQVNYAVE
jgi:UDP-glucuronate decarboxylase